MTSSEICCSNFVIEINITNVLREAVELDFHVQVLKPEERDRLVENIGNHLINTQKFIRDRAVKNFGQADPEFGRKLQAHLDSVSNVSKINVVLVGTV